MNDGRETLRVLLVEDSDDYACLVTATLERVGDRRFCVERSSRLDAALERLRNHSYDAMLLDLSLPDSYGAFTLGLASSVARRLPVVVLTGIEDDALAEAAVKAGAHGYHVKDMTDRMALPELLERAVARHGEQRAGAETDDGAARFRAGFASLHDDVTGLASEVVFCDRLERALTAGERVAVLVVQPLELQLLRELFDDSAADAALVNIARQLEGCLPTGATLARISGDGFGVVLDRDSDRDSVARVADELLDAVAPLQMRCSSTLAVEEVPVTIGIALAPDDGSDAVTLLGKACVAQESAALRGPFASAFYE